MLFRPEWLGPVLAQSDGGFPGPALPSLPFPLPLPFLFPFPLSIYLPISPPRLPPPPATGPPLSPLFVLRPCAHTQAVAELYHKINKELSLRLNQLVY